MSNLILLALRYLRPRRLRTILTTLAISFGVAVLYASSSLIKSMNSDLIDQARLPGEPDVSLVRTTGEFFADEYVLPTVAGVEGVEAVSGVFRHTFAMTIPDNQSALISGDEAASATAVTIVGVNPQTASLISSYPLTDGRFLRPDDERALIIPVTIARLGNIDVGESFPLLTPDGLRSFTVIGLLDDRSISSIQMIVTLTDAQSMFAASGQVTAIDIALSPESKRDETITRLLDAVGTGYEIEAFPTADDPILDLLSGGLYFFGMMALFVGAFLIFNTFRTAVLERQKDLASLRTLGAERKQITQVMLVESLLQGGAGSVLGLLGGALLAIWLANTIGSWGGGAEALDLRLSLEGGILSVSLGIGAALIAGYVPARAAGRVSPLAALYPSEQQGESIIRWQIVIAVIGMLISALFVLKGGDAAIIGGLCFLLSTLFATPAVVPPVINFLQPIVAAIFPREHDLVHNNILRQPRRAAIVVNGLMVSFALFTASAVLVASLSNFFEWLYTQNYLSDVILFPLGGEGGVASDLALGADSAVAEHLDLLPEVTAVSRLRATDALFQDTPINLIGIDPEYAGEMRPLQLYEGERTAVVSAMGSQRAIVINDNLARQFDLQLDDVIQLDTPLKGVQAYTIVGLGDDIDLMLYEPGLVMANRWLESDFGIERDLTLYVNLHEDVERALALEHIKTAVADYPQFVPVELSEFREDAIRSGQEGADFFYLITLAVIVPSLMGLLNTLTINVLERKREIGIMRAVGGDRGQVQRIFIVETLFLGFLGTLFGILVGLVLSISFIQFGNKIIAIRTGLSMTVPLLPIMIGLGVGLVLALLVSTLPARHAAHQDIVQTLRYE